MAHVSCVIKLKNLINTLRVSLNCSFTKTMRQYKNILRIKMSTCQCNLGMMFHHLCLLRLPFILPTFANLNFFKRIVANKGNIIRLVINTRFRQIPFFKKIYVFLVLL